MLDDIRGWLEMYWEGKPTFALTIPLVPPSVNHYLVRTRRVTFKTAAAEVFQSLAVTAFLQKYPGWQPSDATFGVLFNFQVGPNTKFDVDNRFKVAIDAFNGVIWNDDQQITSVFGTKSIITPTKHQKVRDVKQTYIRVYMTPANSGQISTKRTSAAFSQG